MRPSQTILVLEDLRNTFVGPLYRKGVELSLKDRETVMDVYQQWLLLMIDLGYLHHGTLKRDAQRLWSDLASADVLVLNNAFAELLGKLRTQDMRGFKALCGGISSHLYPMIKDDVRTIPEGNVYAAQRLMQLTSYTSRLTLNDIDLTQQCLEDYMQVEEMLSSDLPYNLCHRLNKILKEWLKPFDPSRMLFSHGPGGVAGHGRTSLEDKYKDLTTDALLIYAFGAPSYSHSPYRSTCDRISQTIFVPKSYKTFRTISMESSTTQYYQQGVWKEIDRIVANSSFLENRIGFHEQERNAKLAKTGSIDRNYATIDLSAASDSVSYALVKKVFRGTKLLRYLVATRSSKTYLPDGRLIDLKKFAPMGSALCFPVETLIFASICALVTREHGVYGDFSVFGDDIIVPTQCAEDVMKKLTLLGFHVDRDKSFFSASCWFRESCGAEYADGFDVTPMRISRNYNHEQQLERVSGLVDLANEAYKRNYRNLRHFFIRKLRSYDFIPHFHPDSLQSDNYTNYHTERRWNDDLQRIDCQVSMTKASKPKKNQCEEIRYRHWLESTASRNLMGCVYPYGQNRNFILWKERQRQQFSVGDGFQSRIDRTSVSLKRQWMEKPYEGLDQPFIDYFTIESEN